MGTLENGGMDIIWDGIREMKDRIDELIEKADDAARIAVTEGGHLIERNAKKEAPVLTGTLRRSIHVSYVKRLGRGRWESSTGPSTIYARFREFGGTIRPKNAQALSWIGSNGTRLFAQSVTQKGNPYMQKAFDESVGGVRDIYKAAFREALDI